MKIDENMRSHIIELVREAYQNGARKSKACNLIGISVRTIERWQKIGIKDRRKGPISEPKNKLNQTEKNDILNVCNCEEFCNEPPSQIVPKLADRGVYMASESSFYRILRENKMLTHRLKSKVRRNIKPKPLVATGPGQILSWDITYLPSNIRGGFYYLYMIIDVYSRKIVGHKVHLSESAINAALLINEVAINENIIDKNCFLHSDNGSPMKGATMLATLQKLGIMPSFSRPSVSNDNPYSESLFRTLKYCPEYPKKAFSGLENAISWVNNFVNWYNNEHLHSSLKFISPANRHNGCDLEILKKRETVYNNAKNKHPFRWSKNIRNWTLPNKVFLNPLKEKEQIVKLKQEVA